MNIMKIITSLIILLLISCDNSDDESSTSTIYYQGDKYNLWKFDITESESKTILNLRYLTVSQDILAIRLYISNVNIGEHSLEENEAFIISFEDTYYSNSDPNNRVEITRSNDNRLTGVFSFKTDSLNQSIENGTFDLFLDQSE
jgi:hypothetical protein